MKNLITDEVLQLYSFRGIKRNNTYNLRFDTFTNLLGAIYNMFVYAKDALKRLDLVEIPSVSDVETKISDHLRYSKDRMLKKALKNKAE